MCSISVSFVAIAIGYAAFLSFNVCFANNEVICGTIGRRFYGRRLNQQPSTVRMCFEACKKNTHCNAVNHWSNKTCQLVQTESRHNVEACQNCFSSFVKKECNVTTQPSNPMSYTFVLPELTAPFRLQFTVRVPKAAIIALATDKEDEDIFCHITLGGWNNDKAAIRTGDLKTEHSEGGRVIERALFREKKQLNANEDRAFWIEYDNGVVQVGKGGNGTAFMEWDSTTEVGDHSKVNIAISTWSLFSGDWSFEQNCE